MKTVCAIIDPNRPWQRPIEKAFILPFPIMKVFGWFLTLLLVSSIEATARVPVTPTPESATKAHPFVNSLGMKFVPIPGTRVLFCIHDTRKGDYAAYASADAGVNPSWQKTEYQSAPVSESDDHPVIDVTWKDAQAFCAWLSSKEDRVYRLPTDHEWSLAAGIGDRENAEARPEGKSGQIANAYGWGTAWPPPSKAGNFADQALREKLPSNDAKVIEGYRDGFPTTSPVMSFAPNKFGLYDMAGNVFQWCEDKFSAVSKVRTLRGNSWFDGTPPSLLLSRRIGFDPGSRSPAVGFRCVLEPGRPPVVNSLGMKFVAVPGTKVMFCIHDTRKRDFRAYGEANPEADNTWRKIVTGETLVSPGEEYPVAGVTWDEAKAFCGWLSRKEKRAYRLPTDQEWSLAVGIGHQEDPDESAMSKQYEIRDVYPWGNTWPPPTQAGNFADESLKAGMSSWRGNIVDGYKDGFVTTAPVMTFAPNKLGLFDMAGNVFQWCEDAYKPQSQWKVLRGSSWKEGLSAGLWSCFRKRFLPGARGADVGFRVALVPDANQAELEQDSQWMPPVTPQNATLEHPYVNALGMKFVPVPGTSVLFCIHDTRRRDYEVFDEANSGMDKTWRNAQYNGVFLGWNADNPVVAVNLGDADYFCQWLTFEELNHYRLPTDHEWSMAVGIGDREDPKASPEGKSGKIPEIYSWGSAWPPPAGTGNFADIAFKEVFPNVQVGIIDGYKDGFATVSPVMSFPPNKLGLFDMAGNVWQWIQEKYNPEADRWVLRGGSWFNGDARYFLSSYRAGEAPDRRHAHIGFRPVLALEQAVVTAPNLSPSGDLQATKEAPFINSLELGFVPAGTPGCFFSVCDTRVKDFAAFVKETQYDAIKNGPAGASPFTLEKNKDGIGVEWRQKGGAWNDPHFKQTPNDPVVCVSYADAQAFCEWLTKKEHASGKLPASFSYRLPTDDEWTRACGETEFPWGSYWPPGESDGNYCGIEANTAALPIPASDLAKIGYRDEFSQTSPPGNFRPNRFGLYDMGGNVWQWCATWYQAGLNDKKILDADTSMREDGGGQAFRVNRGASWISDSRSNLLSSYRAFQNPRYRASNIGFRCVLSSSSAP
jgi:formylglycine-generating enzyme required for sulfatase activity